MFNEIGTVSEGEAVPIAEEELAMPVVIRFDREEDHERAIDVLADAEETYHGVARASILVSSAAFNALRANGIRFHVVGENQPEERDGPAT
jgi:hypothetical protein